MTTAKELLVCFQRDYRAVMVLVPKQRGEGMVKVPLGHHQNALSALCYEIGYDCFGLEGHLHFDTGYIRPTKDAVAERIGDALAEHYGMDWRIVDEAEFWANHPVTLTGGRSGK